MRTTEEDGKKRTETTEKFSYKSEFSFKEIMHSNICHFLNARKLPNGHFCIKLVVSEYGPGLLSSTAVHVPN